MNSLKFKAYKQHEGGRRVYVGRKYKSLFFGVFRKKEGVWYRVIDIPPKIPLTLVKLEMHRRHNAQNAMERYGKDTFRTYGNTAYHLKGCFIPRPELDGRCMAELSKEEFYPLNITSILEPLQRNKKS